MASALAIKLGLTRLPDGVCWSVFIAGSFLCGIGFTMSLFLTSLTFVGEANSVMASAGKVGTLLGSVTSAVVGCTMLFLMFRGDNSNKQSGKH